MRLKIAFFRLFGLKNYYLSSSAQVRGKFFRFVVPPFVSSRCLNWHCDNFDGRYCGAFFQRNRNCLSVHLW